MTNQTEPMTRFKQAYALIESIMSENDNAHNALTDALEALDDAYPATLRCFQDEFGKPTAKRYSGKPVAEMRAA